MRVCKLFYTDTHNRKPSAGYQTREYTLHEVQQPTGDKTDRLREYHRLCVVVVLSASSSTLTRIFENIQGLSTRHGKYDPPLTSVVGTSYYMDPALLAGSYDR